MPEPAETLDSPPNPAPAPTINSWFYLVNGTWFQNQDPSTSPVPGSVLTASGAAPNGAPNPNGGMGVRCRAHVRYWGTTQLWKAVSWNGNIFLRSAESFKTYQASGGSGGVYPSPLTGSGGALVYLDLGWDTVTSSLPNNSAQQLGLFWNQSGSPTGDQSAFQQWSYGSDAMLENMNGGLYYLWNDNGAGAMGLRPSYGPDQYNTWYAYPDYFMNQVVNQPSCNPAFPAWAPATTIQTTGTNPATGATDQTIIQTTATVVTSAAYCVPAAPVKHLITRGVLALRVTHQPALDLSPQPPVRPAHRRPAPWSPPGFPRIITLRRSEVRTNKAKRRPMTI